LFARRLRFEEASSGPSPMAIMEPKEIGILSIAALTAALVGPFMMVAGAVVFLAVILRARSAGASSPLIRQA